MREQVGDKYIFYKLARYFYLVLFIFLLKVIMCAMNITKIFKVSINSIILVLVAIFIGNIIFIFLIKNKYSKYVFYEINNRYIRVGKTYIYTFIAKESTAPLRNILDYKISQGYLAKFFGLYITTINCGSEKLKLYVAKNNIENLEKVLDDILINNLEYRRYKDE